ncbi:MAG: DNA repair protein RecN [Myxococcales bacterium]|nr:DNA repair protein RecN [Myxococcales bacterium]MCB9645037.1 DNA repair protein RecN [Deltaproteobacteria bacterium]
MFSTVLTHLTIQNLALVERIELTLGPGLNVLTGETGAGKSVLVGALSLILGGRAQTDVVRSGADEAVVEALFEVPAESGLARRLAEVGIEAPDGALVVRRTVSRSGRGRVLMNGQLATVSMLASVLRGAVDLTSQHEHVSLLDPDQHLDIVDAYGALTGLREAVAERHAEVQGYRSALEGLELDEAEKARREDYLRFALEEIQAAAPAPGEVETLEIDRKRLRGAHDLLEGVQRAESTLYSDEGAVVDAVGRVQRELVRLANLDGRLGDLSTSASNVLAELEDLARGLSRYSANLEAEPGRLDEVEERLEQLRRLCRKYGGTVEAALSAREAMAQELDTLEHDEARRADLGAALEVALEQRARAAEALTAARRKVVAGLALAIQRELADLSMGGTRVEVQLAPTPEPGPRGAEGAELLISPNPGEPLRPLRKSASGGELSRVLLAIKQVLADTTPVGTYVFDEIDTGIGGKVAEVLGAKLQAVARATQVVAVTHLPQVAAYADRHFQVVKLEEGGRTVTRVQTLVEGDRVEELARMLGGVQITERTRGLAEELRTRGRGHPPDPGVLAAVAAEAKRRSSGRRAARVR